WKLGLCARAGGNKARRFMLRFVDGNVQNVLMPVSVSIYIKYANLHRAPSARALPEGREATLHERDPSRSRDRGEGLSSALAEEERPGAADTLTVERTPVRMLAVSVAVVSPIERVGWRLDREDPVDHTQRILHPRVERAADTKAHELREIEADQLRGVDRRAVTIAQLDSTAVRSVPGRWRDAYVVAAHAELAGQSGVLDIAPTVEPLVPIVGELGAVCFWFGSFDTQVNFGSIALVELRSIPGCATALA
ncbi:MAG: hypothetical protein ACREU2_10210, partial [Steroidobacteraceae bacterium]